MQSAERTSMVVYMFLHFIYIKFLDTKLIQKKAEKKCNKENYVISKGETVT